MAKNYSAKDIQVLEGLEAVRKRPSMYIGSVGVKGLHHLVWEVVDNAIDEALAGYCTDIEVIIHPENEISVQDNGRGIPIGIRPKEKRSALEVVMTKLHAGGKFGGGGYKVSGGLHGVGVSCVNALSSFTKATVHRDGKVAEQTYAKGVPQSEVTVVGTTDRTGTTILFKPDHTIFKEDHRYKYKVIADRLRELSFLNAGLKIKLIDRRTLNEAGVHEEETFYTEVGLKDYLLYLGSDRDAILPEPICISAAQSEVHVEAVIAYNTSYELDMNIKAYANNIHTFEGGVHIAGFNRGFSRVVKQYGEREGFFAKAKIAPIGEDFQRGRAVVLSIKLPDPEFSGQEKTKLMNTNIASIVDQVVSQAVQTYLEEHPKEAKILLEKVVFAAEVRQATKKARDLYVQRKNVLTSMALPGKLTDCSEKDPALSELFLLEGDSAGGIAKQGRNRETQAILPLRGKVLNIERVKEHKILESVQIRNIITALGIVFENTDQGRVANLSKLRYHKVCIMTDADVDGSHIRTLILTLFFRYMPELIRNGHIYIALPPLYQVKKGKQSRYCWTEEEKQEAIQALKGAKEGKASVHVQRYKGLGEMNADQLWDTTLNPATRILQKVTISSAMEADRIFSVLMGDDIPPRRAIIEKHAKYVLPEDII